MSVDDVPDVLINMDDPEHARQRRILARAFTVASAERWRVPCREIAHDLPDQADRSGVDLVADYALPLSSRVICQVLGVPTQDYPRFRSWSSAFLSASRASMAARMDAFSDFMSYGAQLVAARRANPGRDLVDDLIHARDEDDQLSEDELVTMLFALITAGLETTTMMISRGAYRLLLHPERYRELVATPSLLHSTVEEILRYDGPGTPGLLRRLTADLELPSGAVVAAGTVVLPDLRAANHDPHAFNDPHVFDIHRYAAGSVTRPHLAFGLGPHFCLGHALARVELQEALSALILRAPGLRPAVALEDVPWTTEGLTHQPLRLPVELA